MSARAKLQEPEKIPAEISSKLRALAHDLSNSLETIMQASYLLSQAKLDEDARKWTELVEKAGRDCAKINREIRDILRANS
jgi:signal transduction histidine kinase